MDRSAWLGRTGLVIGLLVVAVDQLTKAIVVRTIALHESVTVIPNLVDFTHVRNTGAAFGLLSAVDFPYKSAVITVIAAAALLAIALYAGRFGAESSLARSALALILGGAVGNLIDRARLGYVVDFVDVYWGEHHFWAFNVADSAITIGAALLILDIFRTGRDAATAV